MSKLLLDDQPLIVLPKLATKIGLNESIIVQQMHYWLTQKQNARDGYYWVYNTYPEWVKQFPFWSESTVKRAITNLQNLNILIVGNYNKLKIDKTKWYRINYDELMKYEETEVFDGRVKLDSTTGQIDLFDSSKWSNGKVNMNRALPESTTETSTKTTKDNKDIVDDKSSTHSANKKSKRIYEDSEEPMILAKYLFELMKRNNPYVKEPDFQVWANHIRLMNESDKVEYPIIKNCIGWCQQDQFWSTNILSAKKLREKFPTLYAQANRKGGNYNGSNTKSDATNNGKTSKFNLPRSSAEYEATRMRNM